jgi:hypothetical protein
MEGKRRRIFIIIYYCKLPRLHPGKATGAGEQPEPTKYDMYHALELRSLPLTHTWKRSGKGWCLPQSLSRYTNYLSTLRR